MDAGHWGYVPVATLSEDKDSWKARGIIRRDTRNDKSKPENEESPALKKHKNKAKWCKGKVGVEHSWIVERVEIGTPYRWAYSRWVCSKCEKKNYRTPRGQKKDALPTRTIQR